MGGFNGNILKFRVQPHRVDANQSIRCAWLCLAERGAARLALTRELLCLGFAFLAVCQHVGGFMGSSPPVLLLSQVLHLQHAREMR